eukprot:scaffold6997_cov417-Prasinococcus_capsulatus_cf.AAC.2
MDATERSFGCRADCGLDEKVTPVLLVLQADFRQPVGRLKIQPSEWGAATSVAWNLCDNDRALCWYEADQTFDALVTTVVNRCAPIHTLCTIVWHLSPLINVSRSPPVSCAQSCAQTRL